MNCAVIIPTLNPTDELISFVQRLASYGFQEIIVVDDGTTLPYSHIFEQLSSQKVTILHHKKNLGKGAALKTGIQHLKNSGICGFITADSDGQHDADDVYRVACALLAEPEKIILGCRNFSLEDVPFRSRFGNHFSSFFFRQTTGISCQDTQTGLRGIPLSLSDSALSIHGDRYDYEMNFLIHCAKSGISFEYIPIKTLYEDKNQCSHFRPVRDSLLIFKEPLKFASASFCSAIVDVGAFFLFTHAVFLPVISEVFWANIIARCISGLCNFYLNRNWSFKSDGFAGIEFLKYMLLFLAQMLASSFLVTVFSSVSLPATVVKIIIDCLLFFISYLVQKKLIFTSSTNKL